MADHRAEQILVAFITSVTGLVTTGARVFRGRMYPLQEVDTPGLCVYMGPDNPTNMFSQQQVDSLLTVLIEAKVKTSAQQVDTLLNQIRKETTIALQANHTLGLAFVHTINEGEADKPDLSGEADKPIASQLSTWTVQYRRSRTDPSL